MNNLLEALNEHYVARGCLLLDIAPDAYHAVLWRQFHEKWDVVLYVEAVTLDEVSPRLADLVCDYPNSRPVLATWADGITKGDEAAIQAAGITVLAFEKEAAYAMQEMS